MSGACFPAHNGLAAFQHATCDGRMTASVVRAWNTILFNKRKTWRLFISFRFFLIFSDLVWHSRLQLRFVSCRGTKVPAYQSSPNDCSIEASSGKSWWHIVTTSDIYWIKLYHIDSRIDIMAQRCSCLRNLLFCLYRWQVLFDEPCMCYCMLDLVNISCAGRVASRNPSV